MIRHVALLVLCLILAGCGVDRVPLPAIEPPADTPKPPDRITPPKPGETDTEKALREARNTVSRLAGDLATWQQRVTILQEDAKREQREKVLGYLRACLLWASGLALLGGLACIVLAIVSPVAKSTLARLGIACACVLVICAGMLWALPWLPVFGVAAVLSLVIAGVVFGVWRFVIWYGRHMHAAVSMADGLQQVTDAAAGAIDGSKLIGLQVENRAHQIIKGAIGEGDKLLDAARTMRDKRAAKMNPQPINGATHV